MDEESLPMLDPQLETIQWPAAFSGQRLFIQGEDWQYNAMLNWCQFRGDLYAFAYKDAADTLVEAMGNRQVPLDSGIYPLLFLYRHSLELQFKLMLKSVRALTGKEPKNYDKHPLMPLWSELRNLLKELGLERSDANATAVHEFIRQLDEVDPDSMAFRYATTKSGKDHLLNVTHINIRHLCEVLNSVFVWLNGVYGWIGEIQQGQPGE